MSRVEWRVVTCVALVSGLAALAVALIRGAGGGVGVTIAGVAAAVLAFLGFIVLARVVVVTERSSRRRR